MLFFDASRLALVATMGEDYGSWKALRVVDSDAARRGRVLLIDDEAFIVAALRRLLRTEHDVTAVMSVPDALSLVEAGHCFDVILCDVRMPGMSGIDFYEKLRTLAPAMTSRIVFCTGATFASDTRRFFERVSNELLEKPFDPGAVRSLVRRFVVESATCSSL